MWVEKAPEWTYEKKALKTQAKIKQNKITSESGKSWAADCWGLGEHTMLSLFPRYLLWGRCQRQGQADPLFCLLQLQCKEYVWRKDTCEQSIFWLIILRFNETQWLMEKVRFENWLIYKHYEFSQLRMVVSSSMLAGEIKDGGIICCHFHWSVLKPVLPPSLGLVLNSQWQDSAL